MTEPIDRNHLDEMTGGDAEFAAELIEEFVRATEILIADLSNSLHSADAEGVRVAAHGIKGSALSVGATEIGEAARAMEEGAARGDLAGLEGQLDRLSASFSALKEFQL